MDSDPDPLFLKFDPDQDPLFRKGGPEDPDPLFPEIQNEMDPQRCFVKVALKVLLNHLSLLIPGSSEPRRPRTWLEEAPRMALFTAA